MSRSESLGAPVRFDSAPPPGDRLALITDALPALVAYIDLEQRYRFVNTTFERWFGRPRAEAIGRSVAEVLGAEIYDQIRAPLARALAGESVRFQVRVKLPLLGERELEIASTPDIASDGSVRGTVELVTDVTDAQRSEAARERGDRRHLEEAAARNEYVAAASRAFAMAESSLPSLLQAVVEQVAGRFGDVAGIALGGRHEDGGSRSDGESALPVVFFDRDAETGRRLGECARAGEVRRAIDEIVGSLVASNRALLVPSVARPPEISPPEPLARLLEQFPIRSLVAVPLRVRERVIGAIACARRTPGAPFTADDQSDLQQVADRAAISIGNARLLAELNEANAQTDLLYELTDAVNRAETLEGVYAPALSAISRQVRVDRCALLLFDPDGVIRFKAWRGLSDAYRSAVEGHSPWRQDDAKAAAIVVTDVRGSAELASLLPALESERVRALAFIPLAHGDRLLGKFMLYADEPRAFSDPEIRVAQTIADQVAAAVVRKQSKADRERLIEELTRTVKLNELFAGILGHDLRNPLGAILMSAKVLVGKLSDPVLVRTVARIIRSGQRMNRMITQLLDFTRARAGKGLPIERARTDVALVFRQAIDELPDAATIEPPVHLEQDGDTRGWWDADRLSQVASNLIVNAIRHGKASAPVAARIDGRDPARVTVEVSNAGTIPAEILPGIFEPFHRGDLRDAGGGLGLGLFITREIVTAHQGKLEVTSSDDNTTFKFQLPRGADPASSAR